MLLGKESYIKVKLSSFRTLDNAAIFLKARGVWCEFPQSSLFDLIIGLRLHDRHSWHNGRAYLCAIFQILAPQPSHSLLTTADMVVAAPCSNFLLNHMSMGLERYPALISGEMYFCRFVKILPDIMLGVWSC